MTDSGYYKCPVHRGFIAVGYDGGQNVTDKEHRVGRKKPGRKTASNRGIPWPRWTGFRGMTVRDWMQLLIIPLALVVIGLLFDLRQQGIEEQRAERERELARQRAQDEALQAYLDQMSSLLLEKALRTSGEDSEVRTLARARTLTVLGGLDPSRKTAVMQFLADAELVQRVDQRGPIVELSESDLGGADLSEVNLRGAELTKADLSHAALRGADLSHTDLREANLNHADLREAYMSGAELTKADLSHADLSLGNQSGANLWGANLSGTNLSTSDLPGANLSFADLPSADLHGSDLREVNLSHADLPSADLSGANLDGADLSIASLPSADLSWAKLDGVEGVTGEELEQQAKSLEEATMPNGQKYEEWLKSKGRGDDGKNGGPS